ncbi:MAG TPA: site-specific integrase [Candidatus Avidehalobacter gallistercoris]|uniref:Site-specific integrase n=1 Tax=Candidatus Avidehalobacter gallistercoris TaxID=2840694 RepID=A0A9D1HKM3_9FIRM|nr:site-specific integrase [Candidatus Avidehalobacter gallistercoris]
MPAYKDDARGTWFVSFYYDDWQGEHKRKMKRGFASKKEALAWEREFLLRQSADPDMEFGDFVRLYLADKRGRLRESTWVSKIQIIDTKLLPFFARRKLTEIETHDVIAWQNEMLSYRSPEGEPYAPTYLRAMHNQLSAVFNHAVLYYGLKSNPAALAGSMGKESSRKIQFWTQEEYRRFIVTMQGREHSYLAFELLYWCGMRVGELLALTPADFDLSRPAVSISKSYQRLNQRDFITEPKTPKGIRIIQLPPFLAEEVRAYLAKQKTPPDARIFPFTKKRLHDEMRRGAAESGVKRIRIHDLRHSHISLLIDLGFSAVAIADRVGHESIDITYRYAHLFPSRQEEMVRRLESLHGEE